MKLTKAVIDALPLPTRRTRYHDSEFRSLILAVTPKGAKTWYVRRRVRGRVEELRLGPYPDMPPDSARRRAAMVAGAIAEGEDPARAAAGRRGEPTMGEIWEWWLQGAQLRRKTWPEDERRWEAHLRPLAPRRACDITREELRRLHARIGSSKGQTEANRVMELLRAVLNRAIREGLTPGPNPAAAVDRFQEESRERRLSLSEARALLAAIDASPHPYLGDLVSLAFLTGARRGNLLAMRWDQLDLERGEWRIPRTKSGRAQVVALGAAELKILEARRAAAPGPWIFPSLRGAAAGHVANPHRVWADLLKTAGISDFHWHDLRRSLASFMIDTGTPLATIGSALGHRSLAATAIYARLALDPVREAKAAAHAIILGAEEAPPPLTRGRLQQARQEASLSLVDLADLVGVSRAVLADWEADKRTPDLGQAMRVAAAVGVTVEMIWGSV